MAMNSYFCNKCNRTVQDGNSHCRFFDENDEFFYYLRQRDEELDINLDDATAIFDDKNGDTGEAAQVFGNFSQTSTSLVHSDSSIDNKELDGWSFGESADSADRPFAQDASFHSFERIRILDARANEPIEMEKFGSTVPETSMRDARDDQPFDLRRVPGPSTISHQRIRSDGGGTYVCDQCTFRCKYKSKLDRHYRKHTGAKPYACDICDKRFSRKEHLTGHERIHTREKPYRCGICKKDFAQKQTLASHLKWHTGEWLHVCEKCEKGFSRRGHLERHLRTHTGERPFECQICGRKYSVLSNLRRHVATPCRGPYSCRQCTETFSCNEDRNRHIMQEHP